MIIKGVSLVELKSALLDAASCYGIVFKHFPRYMGERKTWMVSLKKKKKVKGYWYNTHKGVLHDIYSGERTNGVCWHAHRWFFDGLPEDARIKVRGRPWFTAFNGFSDWECNVPELSILMSQRCTCDNGGAIGFTPLQVRHSHMSGYDQTLLEGLSAKDKILAANKAILLERHRIVFNRSSAMIRDLFSKVGNIPEHVVDLHVSRLETWNTDVLNRFTESRQGYAKVGG